MTDALILSTYEDFMDGQSTLSQTTEIVLANAAKNRLETELKLEITKKLDTSNTSVLGGTYTTSYPLQADYFENFGYLYVGYIPYTQIPFEQRETNKYNPRVFYVDQVNKLFYICGKMGRVDTITFPYIYKTPDITTASVTAGTTTVTWPDRFHIVIAMEMAKRQYAIDAGDKTRAWDDRWGSMYLEERAQLVNWDHALKLAGIAGATPYGSNSSYDNTFGIPLSLM